MKLKTYRDNTILRSTILSVLSLFGGNSMADPLPPQVGNSDYHYEGEPGVQKVQLGKFLFFDKILSGNKDISCGTCHNPQFGTGDSLSLPIGTGGDGGGQLRVANTASSRVPRHTLSLYNSGAKEFTAFSSDGDFMLSPSGQFIFPGGNPLPPNLENLLAVQA
ncbi:MAG: cytochrome-c peroxidase, partial [Methylococcaceae bacterium]